MGVEGVEQIGEVTECPQAGVDGRVATGARADGPRAPGILGRGRQGVVAALSKLRADGVDRRQVEHVEAHGRQIRHPPRRAPKAAVAAGKQLVPRAHQRPRPIDPDRNERTLGPIGASLGASQGGPEAGGESRCQPLLGWQTVVLQGTESRQQDHRVPAGGQALFHHQHGFGDLDVDVLTGTQLDPRLVGPGGVAVRPRLDGQMVQAEALGTPLGPPLVVSEIRHDRHRRRSARIRRRPVDDEAGGDDVVTVLEHRGPDRHHFPHGGLGGIAARRRPGPHIIDHDMTGHALRLRAGPAIEETPPTGPAGSNACCTDHPGVWPTLSR